ncbi:MAG: ABC transporter substrate-binding protein, partial [Geodermatophilaceae bacterium]|nr:ABC transporter substrate-binding protein [Geodermatophilaceae bacterium]
IVLQRNPEWDPASDPVRTALPDRVKLRTGLSGADRDQLVIAGALDADLLPGGVQPETLARIAAEPRLAARADQRPSGTVRMIALPAGVAPMDNVHCRRAVALALDRTTLVARLGGPEVLIESVSLWPRGLPGYAQPSDPAGPVRTAQQAELAACGQPDGLALTLAAPDEERPMEVAAALADVLGDSGVRVEVVGVDPATYYSTGIGVPANVAAAGYQLLLTAWSADLPTPATYFPPLIGAVTAEGNANYAEVVDPVLSALVDSALGSADPAMSERAWRDLDAGLVGLVAYLPLVEERVVLLAGERLRNASVHVAYGSYDLAVAGVR